ncbi:MAG: sodium:solute symporter family protein [Thaumarchaeota archaeon]|nr:sodium:solute symporter family protein [Nitrososphaerota archaeon]
MGPSSYLAGIYFIIMVVLFLLTSYFGIRRGRGFEEYSIAGRSIGGFVNGMAGMASYLSAFLYMGMTGAVVATGFPYMGALVPFALSIAIFMALIGPYARNTGARTLIEFIELRYGRTVAYLALAVNFVFIGMFMIGQMKAVGICIEYIFKIPYATAIFIGGIILTTYCVVGGMFGITWNQFIQGLLMLIGIAVPLALVLKAVGVASWYNPFLGYGDLSPIMESAGFFNLVKTPQYYLSLALVGLGGAAAAPQVFVISARARDAPSVRWALSWMVLFVGLVYACAMGFAFAATYWIKTSGIVIEQDKADYVLFMLCDAMVPSYISALVVAAALAAAFSTLASLLAFCGIVAVTHIYEPLKKLVKKSNVFFEGEKTTIMVIATAVAGTVCTLLAWSPPSLLVVPIMWGWELLTSTLLIPCVFALWWKRATKWGSVASIMVGAMVVFTQGWTGPLLKMPFYGCLVFLPLSALVHIIISYLTPPDSTRTLLDIWHGFADYSERRYSSKLLPLTFGIVSILMLWFASTGLLR